MRKTSIVKLLAFLVVGSSLMYGQATRTWVSGVGDDANPCSRTAPCKTFAGAISKTAPGGEIDALDPGGFGALTITKSITIDGGGGQVASVLVAGTNGIVVAAGPSDIVVIRNLRFDGLRGAGNANAGLNGIRFISGADLNIENVWVLGFNTNCIDISLAASATVHIVNTVTKNCGNNGVRAITTAGTVKVAIDNSQIMLSGNNGVEAIDNTRITVNRSLISASGGRGVVADGAGSPSISLDYCDVVDGAGDAILATAGNTVWVSHSTLAYNAGTAYNAMGGTVNAFARGAANAANGTNRVHDNGATGNPTYVTEN